MNIGGGVDGEEAAATSLLQSCVCVVFKKERKVEEAIYIGVLVHPRCLSFFVILSTAYARATSPIAQPFSSTKNRSRSTSGDLYTLLHSPSTTTLLTSPFIQT